RQPGRIVHRARLPPHVALPGVGAALPSASGLLLAAEGAADLCPRRTDVDVGDAAIGAGGGKKGFGLADIEGEDAGREALAHVVVDGDRLFQSLVAERVEDRRE